MTVRMYQVKSGKYAGMWHVRGYANRRYFHVGRYRTLEEAQQVINNYQGVPV